MAGGSPLFLAVKSQSGVHIPLAEGVCMGTWGDERRFRVSQLWMPMPLGTADTCQLPVFSEHNMPNWTEEGTISMLHAFNIMSVSFPSSEQNLYIQVEASLKGSEPQEVIPNDAHASKHLAFSSSGWE